MTITATPASDSQRHVCGLATLAKLIYEGGDIQPLWDGLLGRYGRDPDDAAALMDLSMVLQLTGRREQGLSLQQKALAIRPNYRRVHGDGSALRLLAIMAPGDFMANTPIDFMLEGSNVSLECVYVTPGAPLPEMPEHDVCLLAIGESAPNLALLAAVEPALAAWPRPVVNRAPGICALSRDGVYAMFRDSDLVIAPPVARLARSVLHGLSRGEAWSGDAAPLGGLPVIVRPIDSHAGTGLAKIESPLDLEAYLAEHQDEVFYLSPFIDYSSPDGQFRKYRIAFIGGLPYLSHLAISSHWMVHYLSAGMQDDAAKRAEEADCMARFDDDFARRHHAAFDDLVRRIDLDYFAIDCAETKDGRLLLFEADVAMIVHAMDPPDLYPYKAPQMRKLFSALTDFLMEASQRPAPRN